jgi:O-methyltransferase
MTAYDVVRTHTMVHESTFWDNARIAQMVEDVDGCVVECGVWKGGMSAALFVFLGAERKYYLLDSFQGLPSAQMIDGPAAQAWQRDTKSPTYFNNCKACVADADEIMRAVGCSDYKIVEGWLRDTLPNFDPGPIALLRIDVDWYAATQLCLVHLYHKVASGGAIIFDDYAAWEGCKRAVDEWLDGEHPRKQGDAYYYLKEQ